MAKTVAKKAKAVVRKATAQKPQLKAICDGSHGIDGGVYTFKKGDTLTLSKKAHYDSMKELPCLEEI